MIWEAGVLAVALPAVVFAGVAKGGFANGPAFAATPLIALVLPPAEAVALMLPMLMVMDATALRAYWRRWDRAAAVRLVAGALPGIALGGFLFARLPAAPVQLAIGLLAIAFVVFQLARTRIALPRIGAGAGPALVCGGLAGFSSFVTHAGGPPVAVYLLSRGLEKGVFQATTVVIFAAINAVKFVVYLGLGLFDARIAEGVLVLAPAAVAGTLLGVWAHTRVPARLFFALAYALLFAAGLRLVTLAWPAL